MTRDTAIDAIRRHGGESVGAISGACRSHSCAGLSRSRCAALVDANQHFHLQSPSLCAQAR